PAQKLDIHILIVGISIAAAQGQDANIRMFKSIEDAIISAANAVQPAVHILKLLLNLSIGRRVLRQQIDLFKYLVRLFGRKSQQRFEKVRFLGYTPFGGHCVKSPFYSINSPMYNTWITIHLQDC